mmetsp:Transcript_2677/g.3942  ORF Transcript_2677/g.3942 Transcript_2677/m.3942 type:complete len:204 (+) Transcript_2677:4955-5566(+)
MIKNVKLNHCYTNDAIAKRIYNSKKIKFYFDKEENIINNNIILLFSDVNNFIGDIIIKKCIYLSFLSNTTDVHFVINSPGGSVTSGLAIYDVFSYTDLKPNTTCLALAASMGAFLLASGYRSKRNAFKSSRIMIHQPLGGAMGKAGDIEIQTNELLYFKLLLNSYLSQFTTQDYKKIMTDCDRDFFMSAFEASNYGIIDRVIY